ncbi:PAS domain-containing sensor histidine kinase [Desulfovibrio inopinatus]|uniref:PAS domain-containing sensor histidine kinase n=1 Tax=Desulfovibrio inopinatus TaxID=102109 RepID=UPI00041D702B|nr:PAS domain-containing sensor histidine kinase [Desulfovibrio inopinatus]
MHEHDIDSPQPKTPEYEELRRRVAELETEITRLRAENVQYAPTSFHLFDHLPLACHNLDTTGRIVSVNAAWLELFGYTRSDVIGQLFLDFLDEQSIALFKDSYSIFLKDGVVNDIQLIIRHKNGSLVSALFSIRTFPDDAKGTVYCYCVMEDITCQETVYEALAESQNAFRALLDATADYAALVDTQYDIIAANASLAHRMGLTPKQMEGHNILSFVPADVVSSRLQRLNAVVRENAPVTFFDQTQGKHFKHVLYPVADLRGQVRQIAIYSQDITEIKRSEEEQTRSERRLKVAQTMAHIGSFEYDLIAGESLWSDELFRMLGKSPSDPTPSFEDLLQCVHPEDREIVDNASRLTRKQGGYSNLELRFFTSTGELRYGRSSARVEYDATGNPSRIEGTILDITQEKRTEKILRDAKNRYRTFFENSPLGVFTTNLDGRFIEVNQCLANILGYESPRQVVTKIKDIARELYVNPSQRKEILKRIRQNPESVSIEDHFRRKNGTYFVARIHMTMLEDPSGREYLMGIVEDITKRKKAERKLRQAEERYHSIFLNAPVGIYQSLPRGRYLNVNPEFATMHGYASPAQMVKEVSNIATQLYDDPNRREEMVQLIEDNDEVINFEVLSKRRDGSVFWSSRNVRAMRDKDGKIRHYKGFVTDISQKKELETLRDDVERITRHDLKSPLISTISGLKVISHFKDTTPDQLEILNELENTCQRMLAMINFSLDLYKMETGRYEPHLKPIDLAAFLRFLCPAVLRPHLSRGITIEFNLNHQPLPTDVVIYVQAEELLLSTLIENLIKNAAEASPNDHAIRINIILDDPVRIDIHNKGAVPPEIRDSFFEKYVTAGKKFGTGLGSYSAKLIVQTMGGTIDFSTDESSTTLHICLQAASAPTATPEA